VLDELDRGRVVIVAGFQGVSYKREITTLGRGGSDTTAVALAAALDAECCEICSDVDGVYSADPRIVGAAELLDAISHDQMLELAAHGAKVLHAEAVEAARRFGVALYARATSGGGEGTRIDVPKGAMRVDRIAGVTGHKNLVRMRARSAESLLALAQGERLPMQALAAGPDRVELVIALDDIPDWPAVRERARATIADLVLQEGVGAVSVVGDFVGRDADLVDRARQAAAAGGIEVDEVVATPLRFTLYCAASAVDRLVAELHRVLRESP
jgi:aspartate kinase